MHFKVSSETASLEEPPDAEAQLRHLVTLRM